MSEMKTYAGSCHCGKVTYEVTTDLQRVNECNCSHCARKGFLLHFVAPEQFKLLSGEDALAEYQFHRKIIRHMFCKTCGVESFAYGKRKDGTPLVAVNMRSLPDVDPKSLTLTFVDGKSF